MGDNLMTLRGYQVPSSLLLVHLKLRSGNRKCKSNDKERGKQERYISQDSSGCNLIFLMWASSHIRTCLPPYIPVLLLMMFIVYSIFCNICPDLVSICNRKLMFICGLCQYWILDKFSLIATTSLSVLLCPLYVLSNLKHFFSGYMSNLHDKRDSVIILHAFEIPPLPYSSGPCESFVTA